MITGAVTDECNQAALGWGGVNLTDRIIDNILIKLGSSVLTLQFKHLL